MPSVKQDEDPYFTLDPNTVGIPSLVVSGIGALYAFYLVFRLYSQPHQLPEDGTESRKESNSKLVSVSEAGQAGVKNFLHTQIHHVFVLSMGFFTLICATINWRTGIW